MSTTPASQDKKTTDFKVDILKADGYRVFDAKSLYNNIVLTDLTTVTADDIVLACPNRCSMKVGDKVIKYDRVYIGRVINDELYPLIFRVKSCGDCEGFRPNKSNPDKTVCQVRLSRAIEANAEEQEFIDQLKRITKIVTDKFEKLCKAVHEGRLQYVLTEHEAKLRNASLHRTKMDPNTQCPTNQYPTLWVDCRKSMKSDGFSTTVYDAETDHPMELKSVVDKTCGGEFAVVLESIYVNKSNFSLKGVLYEAFLNVSEGTSHKRLLGFS